ncbi:MAG: carbonic anhydrase [Candidatus Lokiarchaeota archaeon]|nr:carbonic anhydrase [Candidatus Lokiarchaeota archaeon]
MDFDNMLMEGNLRYKQKLMNGTEKLITSEKIPKYPLLILTCMDPRIDVHRIFQLNQGDAFVLRNAGNTHTPDVLRSVLVATLEHGIKYVVILGHFDCGMSKLRVDLLRKKIKWNVSIKDLVDFFRPFKDEIQHLNEQVKILSSLPQLPEDVQVIAMIYDIKTGFVFENKIIENYDSNTAFWKDYSSFLKEKGEFLYQQNPVFQQTQSFQNNTSNSEEIKAENNTKPQNLENLTETIEPPMLESIINMKLPQIRIPPVHIPEIKIFIPKIQKNRINNA